MTEVCWRRFPLVTDYDNAHRWLQFAANIGRARNTIEAYGRALEDHLGFCKSVGADPLTLRVGLSNATIQQRIVAVRSFYEYLVEDGLRERNPVHRGESGRRGRQPKRGLVRPIERAPWIPNDLAWASILDACRIESLRNRLMVALAYDGALRREELVQIEIDDLEPAYSLIHLRAETTKGKRARDVAYGTATGQLLVGYLRERGRVFGRVNGRLFLSTSRRNRGAPVGPWSWSKIVDAIAERAGLPRFSTHTFRHMRLTDLARADWTVDQIAQYAGHRDLSTTMLYIHLGGRELAARFQRSIASIHLQRERLLATLVEA
jgi:integrase/recombinase XerD